MSERESSNPYILELKKVSTVLATQDKIDDYESDGGGRPQVRIARKEKKVMKTTGGSEKQR